MAIRVVILAAALLLVDAVVAHAALGVSRSCETTWTDATRLDATRRPVPAERVGIENGVPEVVIGRATFSLDANVRRQMGWASMRLPYAPQPLHVVVNVTAASRSTFDRDALEQLRPICVRVRSSSASWQARPFASELLFRADSRPYRWITAGHGPEWPLSLAARVELLLAAGDERYVVEFRDLQITGED